MPTRDRSRPRRGLPGSMAPRPVRAWPWLRFRERPRAPRYELCRACHPRPRRPRRRHRRIAGWTLWRGGVQWQRHCPGRPGQDRGLRRGDAGRGIPWCQWLRSRGPGCARRRDLRSGRARGPRLRLRACEARRDRNRRLRPGARRPGRPWDGWQGRRRDGRARRGDRRALRSTPSRPRASRCR